MTRHWTRKAIKFPLKRTTWSETDAGRVLAVGASGEQGDETENSERHLRFCRVKRSPRVTGIDITMRQREQNHFEPNLTRWEGYKLYQSYPTFIIW